MLNYVDEWFFVKEIDEELDKNQSSISFISPISEFQVNFIPYSCKKLFFIEGLFENLSYQNLRNLTHLYLTGLKLLKAPDLSHLINLKTIWLNNNFLDSLKGINLNQEVENISLSENRFVTLPKELFNNHLKFLDISQNPLKSFYDLFKFEGRKHLEHLIVSSFEIDNCRTHFNTERWFLFNLINNYDKLKLFNGNEINLKKSRDAIEQIQNSKKKFYLLKFSQLSRKQNFVFNYTSSKVEHFRKKSLEKKKFSSIANHDNSLLRDYQIQSFEHFSNQLLNRLLNCMFEEEFKSYGNLSINPIDEPAILDSYERLLLQRLCLHHGKIKNPLKLVQLFAINKTTQEKTTENLLFLKNSQSFGEMLKNVKFLLREIDHFIGPMRTCKSINEADEFSPFNFYRSKGILILLRETLKSSNEPQSKCSCTNVGSRAAFIKISHIAMIEYNEQLINNYKNDILGTFNAQHKDNFFPFSIESGDYQRVISKSNTKTFVADWSLSLLSERKQAVMNTLDKTPIEVIDDTNSMANVESIIKSQDNESLHLINCRGDQPLDLTSLSGIKKLFLVNSLKAQINLEGLSHLSQLEHLDVSHNAIVRLANVLPSLTSLISLDISWNNIENISILAKDLFRSCPRLNSLTAFFNPFYERVDFIRIINILHGNLKNLQDVDSKKTSKFLIGSREKFEIFHDWSHSYSRDRHRIVKFDDQNLGNFECLRNLKYAEILYFRNNHIESLDNLMMMKSLRELYLEGNKISQISQEALWGLGNLERLNLSSNELISVNGLSSLKRLTFLSLADNKISSLISLGDLKRCQVLEHLNMDGNPICSESHFQMYLLSSLDSLIILDDHLVDDDLVCRALKKFSNILTVDDISARISHYNLSIITCLDLSRCKHIKTFYPNIWSEFKCLVYLNLEGNSIEKMDKMNEILTLEILCLNNNKLTDSSFAKISSYHSDHVYFPKLKVLSLAQNLLRNAQSIGLWRMKSLRVLFLQENLLQTMNGFQNIANLTSLILDRNRIRNFDSDCFEGTTRLVHLSIERNQLISLCDLPRGGGGTFNVHRLYLGHNKIINFDGLLIAARGKQHPIRELSILGNGHYQRDPIYHMIINRLPMLTLIDGRQVTVEMRQEAQLYYDYNIDDDEDNGRSDLLASVVVGGSRSGSQMTHPGIIDLNRMALDNLEAFTPTSTRHYHNFISKSSDYYYAKYFN